MSGTVSELAPQCLLYVGMYGIDLGSFNLNKCHGCSPKIVALQYVNVDDCVFILYV